MHAKIIEGCIIDAMSNAAREAIYQLVRRLPEERLPQLHKALEQEIEDKTLGAGDSRSALERADALGLAGCLDSDAPVDLASNPQHLAGLGA